MEKSTGCPETTPSKSIFDTPYRSHNGMNSVSLLMKRTGAPIDDVVPAKKFKEGKVFENLE
jgi:hypothetical protein